VHEYLAVLDDAAVGTATPVVPKFSSPADPAARWTSAKGGQAFFAYCTNYLIDLKNAVIMDVEASTAVRQAELTAAGRMIRSCPGRCGVKFWTEDAKRLTDKPERRSGEKSSALEALDSRKSDALQTCLGSQIENARPLWAEGRRARALDRSARRIETGSAAAARQAINRKPGGVDSPMYPSTSLGASMARAPPPVAAAEGGWLDQGGGS
jgi:hypothetical protein